MHSALVRHSTCPISLPSWPSARPRPSSPCWRACGQLAPSWSLRCCCSTATACCIHGVAAWPATSACLLTFPRCVSFGVNSIHPGLYGVCVTCALFSGRGVDRRLAARSHSSQSTGSGGVLSRVKFSPSAQFGPRCSSFILPSPPSPISLLHPIPLTPGPILRLSIPGSSCHCRAAAGGSGTWKFAVCVQFA